MTIRQYLVMSTATLCLLTLPCQAGPCSKDIERMQVAIDAKLNAIAAAGPSANQDVGAQMHRQPTPRSMANAEIKLGEMSPSTAQKVKEAMTRAHKADSEGDKAACEKALADVQREIGP